MSQDIIYTLSAIGGFILFIIIIGIYRNQFGSLVIFQNHCDVLINVLPSIVMAFPVSISGLLAIQSKELKFFIQHLGKLYSNQWFWIMFLGCLLLSFIISIWANKGFLSSIQSWCVKSIISAIFVIAIPISFILNIFAIVTFFYGGFIFWGVRAKYKYEQTSSYHKRMWSIFLLNIFLTFFVGRWMLRNLTLNICARQKFW